MFANKTFYKKQTFRMYKKALTLDVNMKERFQTCLQTIFQAYMHTNILTGNKKKEMSKKKEKSFSNIHTYKHSNRYCIRETEAQ